MPGPVSTLYDGFENLDASAMARCYAPAARFSDPVFTLAGAHISNMWAMLIEGIQRSSPDIWRLEVDGVVEDATSGRAHWVARYRFGPTGRIVTNDIRAAFVLSDGLIIDHRDTFDLWRWSRQALGPLGVVAGWSAPLRARIRRQAADSLTKFEKRGSHDVAEGDSQ